VTAQQPCPVEVTAIGTKQGRIGQLACMHHVLWKSPQSGPSRACHNCALVRLTTLDMCIGLLGGLVHCKQSDSASPRVNGLFEFGYSPLVHFHSLPLTQTQPVPRLCYRFCMFLFRIHQQMWGRVHFPPYSALRVYGTPACALYTSAAAAAGHSNKLIFPHTHPHYPFKACSPGFAHLSPAYSCGCGMLFTAVPSAPQVWVRVTFLSRTAAGLGHILLRLTALQLSGAASGPSPLSCICSVLLTWCSCQCCV